MIELLTPPSALRPTPPQRSWGGALARVACTFSNMKNALSSSCYDGGGEDWMVSIPECFSESYAEARPKFCSAAAAAGGALRSWLNPKARGPAGEALYLDTARFGADDATNMLVLIAGTHGVEGHCGSGADRRRRRSDRQ